MPNAVEDRWNEIYSEGIDEDAEHHVLAKHLNAKSHEVFHRFVYQAAVDRVEPGARILDAGCGSGYFCDYYARRGYRVDGFDFNADLIRIAKKRYPDLFLEQLNVYDCGRLEGPYDLVVCAGVIQNVTEPERALAAMASVQRAGGLLSICATHARFLGNLVQPLITRLFQSFRMKFERYTPRKLARLADAAGYDLEEVRYVYMFPGPLSALNGPFNRVRWLNRACFPGAVHLCVHLRRRADAAA